MDASVDLPGLRHAHTFAAATGAQPLDGLTRRQCGADLTLVGCAH